MKIDIICFLLSNRIRPIVAANDQLRMPPSFGVMSQDQDVSNLSMKKIENPFAIHLNFTKSSSKGNFSFLQFKIHLKHQITHEKMSLVKFFKCFLK